MGDCSGPQGRACDRIMKPCLLIALQSDFKVKATLRLQMRSQHVGGVNNRELDNKCGAQRGAGLTKPAIHTITYRLSGKISTGMNV